MTNNSWQNLKLSEVVDIISGGTPKTSVSEYWVGSIPWLSVADFNNGKKFVSTAEKSITEVGLKNCSSKLLQKNDIIISARGTVGVVAMLEREMAFNQSCYGIRAKENSTNEYIYYFLKSAVKDFLQVANGGVFDTITRQTFDEIEISLPPLPEQKAIAEVLTSLDDKIDLLHKQNKTLEQLAETLFRHHFIDNAQDDWEERPLDAVVDISIGRTPPRQESQWFSRNSSDIKWISIKDMGGDGVYISSTSECLTKAAVEKFKIPTIPENTVLLSFKMTVGRVVITTEEMLSNEAIAQFKFNHITPFTEEYLYLFLRSFKWDLLGSTSSIVTSINSAMIKEMEIVIPDEDSMLKFEEITKPQFQKIRENQEQIQTLEKLRDQLLPKLMSGEIKLN